MTTGVSIKNRFLIFLYILFLALAILYVLMLQKQAPPTPRRTVEERYGI